MTNNSLNSTARRDKLVDFLIIGLILVTVFAIQFSIGAYRHNLASHPDEAAHFTTGVLVYDYIRSGCDTWPIPFAKSFYVRYPKVAFGHWPPAFYVIQAAWYYLFGGTPASSIALMGAIAFLATSLLYLRLRQNYDRFIAIVSVCLLLSIPMVQVYSSIVMSDMIVCLFCLLAFFAFSDFLYGRNHRKLLEFAAWTSVAFLTKGNAVAMLIFAGIAPLVAGEFTAIWSKKTLSAAVVLLLFAGPFYMTAMALDLDRHLNIGMLARKLLDAHRRVGVLYGLFSAVSPVVFAIAAIQVVRIVAGKGKLQKRHTYIDSAAAFAWVISVGLFQVLCFITGESRYFLPALFPLVILFAGGLDWMVQTMTKSSRLAFPLAIGMTALCVFTSTHRLRPRISGYEHVVASIPMELDGPVLLVSSDEIGEGAMIVERLTHDHKRASIVLRASKVFAKSGWFNQNFQLLVESTQEIDDYLDNTPVHFIVIDNFRFAGDAAPDYHKLLTQTIENAPGQFRLVGSFPIVKDNKRFENAVSVYENTLAEGKLPQAIEIDMEISLGRTIGLYRNGDRMEFRERPVAE